MLSLVAPLMVKRDCIAISHSRVAQIVHGRIHMAHMSPSAARLLHWNRSIAWKDMRWSRLRWRARSCRGAGSVQHLCLQLCHAFHARHSWRRKGALPRSSRELLKQWLVMLAMLALLVGWQTMLGGREVGLRRELWRFPTSTHQMSTHSRGARSSSLYHGHYSRVLKGWSS